MVIEVGEYTRLCSVCCMSQPMKAGTFKTIKGLRAWVCAKCK
jgi:hypothetical protein